MAAYQNNYNNQPAYAQQGYNQGYNHNGDRGAPQGSVPVMQYPGGSTAPQQGYQNAPYTGDMAKLEAGGYDGTNKHWPAQNGQQAAPIAAQNQPHPAWSVGRILLRLAGIGALVALSIITLIFGVQNYNVGCKHPLAAWLIADAVVKLSHVVYLAFYLVESKLRTGSFTREVEPLWFKIGVALYAIFFLAFVFGIGSYWVWTCNTGNCDPDLFHKAKDLIITNYVVFGVIALFMVRKSIKGRRNQVA